MDRAAGSAALDVLKGAAGKNNVKEELACALVEAGEGGVRLSATDLEVGAALRPAGCEVLRPGRALVRLETAASIWRECRADRLRLVCDGDLQVVEAELGGSEYGLPALPPEGFPAWEAPRGAGATLPAEALLAVLRRAAPAAAAAEAGGRYAMAGVALCPGGEVAGVSASTLRAVATDGKRLSLDEAPCEWAGGLDLPAMARLPAVVPAKAAALFCRTLERELKADPEALATLALDARGAYLACGGSEAYSRLVEGRYPDYAPHLEAPAGAGECRLHASALDRLLAAAGVVCDRDGAKVTLAFSAGSVTATAAGSSAGRSRVSEPADYRGPDSQVSLDPKLLRPLLREAGEAAAVLKVAGPAAPLRIGLGGGSWRVLAMPLT